jgi:prepilin-type N-terminal cleavage/methylation domain-containing protein
MHPAASRRPPLRSGFTLIEMMIVLVLFGIVVGGLMTVIRRQQAFYRSAGQMMEVRSQADQAFGILPRDLRAISSVGNDITAFTDTSITFRSQLGSSVLCSKTTNVVIVPPVARLMKKHRLTVWREQPVVGDTLFVYDDGSEPSEVDDSWKGYGITAVAKGPVGSANACPTTTGFITVADTADSWRFTVSPNLSTTIVQGAPIRFGRKVRYALYQAADDEWYIGYQDSTAAGWTARSPVSGPHRAYSDDPGESGLTFLYLDNAENELDPTVPANKALVARIDLTIRGMTKNDVDMPGRKREQFVDSLVASVNLRNRQ